MIYLGYGFLQSEKGSRYSSQNIDRYLPDMSIDTLLTCRPSDVGQYIKQISFCVLVNIDWHVNRCVDQGVHKLHKIQKF